MALGRLLVLHSGRRALPGRPLLSEERMPGGRGQAHSAASFIGSTNLCVCVRAPERFPCTARAPRLPVLQSEFKVL